MAYTAYLNLAGFTALTIMPSEHVTLIQTAYPGWIDGQLLHWSAWIDARLRKRYAVPFTTVPAVVAEWLTRIVTRRAYLKLGIDPTDNQSAEIITDANRAFDEIKEAASSETALFDLPARDDADGTAIVKAAPLGYTEQSPYSWGEVQLQNIIDGDL